MKEIVERILEEEKLAQEHVEEARNKAKMIQLEAEEQAKKIREQAIQQGEAERLKRISLVREKAEKEKAKLIQDAERNLKARWTLTDTVKDKLADKLVWIVLGKERD